jgi:acyl-CoA synthetase (NDP forming)
VDTREFCDLVATISELVDGVPEIAELDLNPVRVLPDGRCVVLDAAVSLLIEPPAVETPAATRDLTPLVEPRSIAVLGVSRDTSRPGGRILRALRDHGCPGGVFPINRAGGEIGGLPAFTALTDLPDTPELVCIVLPAVASVEAVRECVHLGVPAVIVYASGFAEAGAAGRELDAQLRAAVAGSATVLCGPNTIGVVNAHLPMAATFSQAIDGFPLRQAGTTLIAQIGAVAGSLVSRELAEGYGIGDWVTVGNQTSLDVADYVEFFARRKNTTSLAIFLEGVPDGRRFRAALRVARDEEVPVAIFKTATTDVGRRAVASHSGALAGSEVVYRTVLEQERAVNVNRMIDLLQVAWTIGCLRQPTGRRAAVVTTSGGAGSATADLVAIHHREVAALSDSTRDRVTAVLPAFAHVDNPLDVTAEGAFAPGTLGRVVDLVSHDPGVALVFVVLTSITGADAIRIAQEIADAADDTETPVLVSWLVARESAAEGMELLATRGLRVFAEPADMVAAADHLATSTRRKEP